VTKEGLDATEVGAVIEEVGGEGVTEFVGGDVEGDVRGGEAFFEDGINGAGGEAFAEFGDEERAVFSFFCKLCFVAVFLKGLVGVGADGDEAFFVPFTKDADGVGEIIEVGEVEGR